MYAVVQTGGKQYRVTPGDNIVVERLPGQNGDKVDLSDIILVDNEGKLTTGAPYIKDASISATIVDQTRAKKIIVFKQKRRKGYRRKAGHRQDQTVLHISEIKAAGKTFKSDSAAKVVKSEAAPKKVAEKKPAAAKAKPATEKKAPAKAAAAPKKAAEKKPAAAKAPATKAPVKKAAAKKTDK